MSVTDAGRSTPRSSIVQVIWEELGARLIEALARQIESLKLAISVTSVLARIELGTPRWPRSPCFRLLAEAVGHMGCEESAALWQCDLGGSFGSQSSTAAPELKPMMLQLAEVAGSSHSSSC